MEPQPQVLSAPTYAGFWPRFGAYALIDLPLQILAGFTIGRSIGFGGGIVIAVLDLPEAGVIRIIELVAATFGFTFSWLYNAVFESSGFQATLGKLAFGLAVTDLDGRRISFGRATWRFLAKGLSGLFFGLGFLMIPHNAKRQGLHDDLAHTLVWRRARGTPDNK